MAAWVVLILLVGFALYGLVGLGAELGRRQSGWRQIRARDHDGTH